MRKLACLLLCACGLFLLGCNTAPTATLASTAVVPGTIVIVDIGAEFVDLQNIGGRARDISGWTLVSEEGNPTCDLGGAIEPGEILRVWALASDVDRGGYNCGFGSDIWNESEPVPAALYDDTGTLIVRYFP